MRASYFLLFLFAAAETFAQSHYTFNGSVRNRQTGELLCMGFLAAIPVGATQLEIARRAIRGYLGPALMIVAGFWGVGAVLMVLLGIHAIRHGKPRDSGGTADDRALRNPGIGFITEFSLALTNPFMVAYWLLGAHILKSIGIVGRYDTTALIVLLAFRAAGISSSLVILSTGVYTV